VRLRQEKINKKGHSRLAELPGERKAGHRSGTAAKRWSAMVASR
jgi:hypothetical protein